MKKNHDEKAGISHRMVSLTLTIAIAGLAGVIVIMASVPPVDRDALTHHLLVPKLYLQKGSLHEIPDIPFSYYPMNIDLLYLLPLYFNSDIAAKYIHFAFACLTAWLIFGYLQKRLDRRIALSGALFFLSLPIVVKLSISAYVDLGLIFFCTAAMLALAEWVRKGLQVRRLIVAAMWCGLAMGTKYNGLVVFFILSCTVPILFIRASHRRWATPSAVADAGSVALPVIKANDVSRKALAQGALFALVSLAVFSPWMIRNLVWTGNPVYPLYQQFFSPEGVSEESPESKATPEEPGVSKPGESTVPMTHFAVRKIIYGESLAQILMIPLRIFFQGEDDNPKYFDGRLNPFLLLLSILAFIPEKKNRSLVELEKRFFAGFCILFVLVSLFSTDMRIRYVSPVIPPLVILSMFGVDRLSRLLSDWALKRAGRVSAAACLGTVVLALGINGVYIADLFHMVNPGSYLSGRLDRDAYIEERRPEYAAIQYANRVLEPRSKILFLFVGHRLYYSNLEALEGEERFFNVVTAGKSPGDLLKRFREMGITHFLINSKIFVSWADAQFQEPQQGTLNRFFHLYTTPVFSKNGYDLFELRPHDGKIS
jgi:hypothetical protein